MTLRPGNVRGAAFATARDGDGRVDERARADLSARLGIGPSWAWLRQVHSASVVEVGSPGIHGDADAMFTRTPGVILAVGTADCVPIVLEGDGGVGIAHAGWRGLEAGVVGALRTAMQQAGVEVRRAAVGPCIGPCCFEVGPEVAGRFPGHRTTTNWGTTSVDLAAAAIEELAGLSVSVAGVCTRTDARFHSHRRNHTPHRQVSLAWLPG